MSIAVNEQNFDEILKSELPVMVDFGAEWCGPCKALAPIVDEIANEYEGKAVVCTADAEECTSITARFRVRNVPTILFFKGGELKDKAVGSVQKSTLTEKLDALM
ncbi:MAG: thioredoxin [Bacteroidales bacterium]|nr:thioredoxin [Bacteroidales bacterium]